MEKEKYISPVYEVPEPPNVSPALQKNFIDKWKKENPAPKMYCFKSDKEGVSEIFEHEVKDSSINSYRLTEKGKRIPIRTYRFYSSPFSIDIMEGRLSGIDSGYASGYGDLWAWSHFGSFVKEEIEHLHKEETKRVTEKYLSKPLSILFEAGNFKPEEIANILSALSDIYFSISGDRLKIDNIETFEITIPK